jgi:hypothetical protein
MLTRIRDLVSAPLTLDYFQQRQADGWVLAAVEWVRESVGSDSPKATPTAETGTEELPYGFRIADDCTHLERDEREMETIELIFEKVVAGWRPTQIAEELSRRGLTTRQQRPWTPGAVFELLPRLIELSPGMLKRPEWPARRKNLEIIV